MPQAVRRLTADDWAAAALDAIGQGGLAAVAVEPLAARLGATKGSFYWHFANRDALVDAALAYWERHRTEAVITAMEAEPAPAVRLRRLFTQVIEVASTDRVEVRLLATAGDPRVAPVLRRVTERRIAYVAGIFAALGHPPAEARRRGLLAYTAYLGHVQLAHAVPEALPSSRDARQHYLDQVLTALLATPADLAPDDG